MKYKQNWHWIYTYTIFSIFISIFLFATLFEKTILNWYIPFISVVLCVILAYIFVPKILIKMKIPVLKFPFIFFTVFGIGGIFTTILLALNFVFLQQDTSEKYLFSKKEVHFIALNAFSSEGEPIYDYTIKLFFKDEHISKRVIFSGNKPNAELFSIQTHRGLLGFRVITEKRIE